MMSEEHLPLWGQYVQASALVAIALLGAWIAWKQMQIARTKLQLDLYERRYAVFDAARKFLGHIFRHGNMSDEALGQYVVGTADAVFLYDDSIVEYLSELRTNAIDLQATKDTLKGAAASSERMALADRAGQRMRWLVAQLDPMTNKFRPYLALSQRKSRWGASFWK